MPDIMHLIQIDASPERVYRTLTTAEGIRNWWTRDADVGEKTGETGEFRFNGRRFVARVKIEELEPPVRVGWTVLAGAPGWGNTITFDLQPDSAGTRLSFAHRGFKAADDNYAGATTRWGAYLISLKQYLEIGKGSPNPDDIFASARPD
jgi:uncharacterized protein YndB with AHSA1/START domain